MSKACFSGIVLGGVPERRVDAALGRAGVAAGRVDLRDDGDVRARVEGLDRGAHAGAAGADDEHVVRRLHRLGRYRIAAQTARERALGRRHHQRRSSPAPAHTERRDDQLNAARSACQRGS